MTNEARTRSALDAEEREALQAIGWRPAADDSVCPDSSLLAAAEEGVLDDATADQVRAHVKSCAICQQLSKDLALVLAEEPGDAEAARIRARIAGGQTGRRTHPYAWWGVGLAAAAGILWFVVPPKSPPRPAAPGAVATPAPMSVFVVDRPSIPPGDVDLTVRGEASKRVSLEDQIGAALDEADAGDLRAATSDLEGIAKANGTSRIAALALGAVQLRASQNAEAAATLDRARSLTSDPEAAKEVDWFLSIALVRTGQRDRARPLLDGLCKNPGPRAAGACAGIAELDRSGK